MSRPIDLDRNAANLLKRYADALDACDAGDPVPATVLDPFGGVMTTALVANQLGRDSISIELGPKYAAMGARRIQDDAGMLCDITIEEMP